MSATRWPRPRPDFAKRPDLEFDYTLFHAVPGAWPSVEDMRATLTGREWYEHAAFLNRRQRAQQRAMDRARRSVGTRSAGKR